LKAQASRAEIKRKEKQKEKDAAETACDCSAWYAQQLFVAHAKRIGSVTWHREF
jgi:hypothetical protein